MKQMEKKQCAQGREVTKGHPQTKREAGSGEKVRIPQWLMKAIKAEIGELSHHEEETLVQSVGTPRS